MADQSIILWIIGAILTFTGLAGLFLPLVPGAPLLFFGLLLGAWAEGFRYIGLWTLLLLAFTGSTDLRSRVCRVNFGS